MARTVALATFLAFLPFIMAGQAPPVEIDGSKTPELIPDSEGFKVLFMITSDGPHGLPRATRQSYLAGAGLTEPQIDLVIDAANQYRVAMNAGNRKMQQLKAPWPKGQPLPENILLQFDAIFDSVVAKQGEIRKALESELGPEPFRKLLEFVRTRVKSDTTFVMGARR